MLHFSVWVRDLTIQRKVYGIYSSASNGTVMLNYGRIGTDLKFAELTLLLSKKKQNRDNNSSRKRFRCLFCTKSSDICAITVFYHGLNLTDTYLVFGVVPKFRFRQLLKQQQQRSLGNVGLRCLPRRAYVGACRCGLWCLPRRAQPSTERNISFNVRPRLRARLREYEPRRPILWFSTDYKPFWAIFNHFQQFLPPKNYI